MSSAAIQQTSHQPTSLAALNTPPLIPNSPSNRHYASSPGHEVYNSNPQSQASSPSASSRRPINRNIGAAPANAQSAPSPLSSRAAVASPPVYSALEPEYQPEAHERRDRSEGRKNMPPTAPPRTSSTQHTHSGSAVSGSRRAGEPPSERGTDSPRRGQNGFNGADGTGQQYATTSPEAAHSSRSRRQQPGAQESSERASSNRDTRQTNSPATLPIRTQAGTNATTTSSKGPSRETSEILKSVVISQPEVDIERERERLALAQPHHGPEMQEDEPLQSPTTSAAEPAEDGRRSGRSRHDHGGKREKHTKFGEYILGNTIGEGEFGKVKLGWKPEGGVQVAIKLIKKDALGSNPSRMAKIMREVKILQQLTHPNIVRLHKMEESERHYGIVLEYAPGGELFDYIIVHRYLKDSAARRLFAQLVSGVGYLHKKGIVHRDLKLENLLLDRNRNIIITDFGFANTFDPNEELTEEEESKLSDREYVKRIGLDKVKASGSRKADLMQTSCGSPCYAAPELVVSDSLYTGRKVDVWSCGVILYAMLAGYLPFDDDPANPEGDNINLLYKYIVNTPLTFPEYVTPHARDLLRRILVPNPRKRADLFEVARHSWLSDYAHVVERVTSSTTTTVDIQDTTVPLEEVGESPFLARSASVRESSKKAAPAPAVGGLTSKQGTIDQDAEAFARQQKDAKRRTVQVEYVAPITQTQRGEPGASTGAKTRARSGTEGPIEVTETAASSPRDKPLPRDPPVSKDVYGRTAVQSRAPPSSSRSQNVPPARPGHNARATSDTVFMSGSGAGGRPETGGSMQPTGSRGLGGSVRAPYGQPLPPEVAGTSAQGRIQQPGSGAKSYSISNPAPQEGQNVDEYGRSSISGVPAKFARISGFNTDGETGELKGHRRSNTIGEIGGKIFGRSGSIFGGRNKKRPELQPQPQQQQAGEKPRKYPPISMTNAMPASLDDGRQSMDSKRSRRSFSLGLGKKKSGSIAGSQTSQEKQTRRFSLIPQSFSRAIGIGKETGTPPPTGQDLPIQGAPSAGQYGRYMDQSSNNAAVDTATLDNMYGQLQDSRQQPAGPRSNPAQPQGYDPAQYNGRPSAIPGYMQQQQQQQQQQGQGLDTGSDSSLDRGQGRAPLNNSSARYMSGPLDQQSGYDGRQTASRGNRSLLQKNKRFVDAYDTDEYSHPHNYSGSSGPARRVMDFFRRRGKARGGEDG